MFSQTAAYNPRAVIKNNRNDQISEVALMVLFAPDAAFWKLKIPMIRRSKL